MKTFFAIFFITMQSSFKKSFLITRFYIERLVNIRHLEILCKLKKKKKLKWRTKLQMLKRIMTYLYTRCQQRRRGFFGWNVTQNYLPFIWPGCNMATVCIKHSCCYISIMTLERRNNNCKHNLYLVFSKWRLLKTYSIHLLPTYKSARLTFTYLEYLPQFTSGHAV